jgi:hypothetical protein
MLLNLLAPLLMDSLPKPPEDHYIILELPREQDILLRALWLFSSENSEKEFEVCSI